MNKVGSTNGLTKKYGYGLDDIISAYIVIHSTPSFAPGNTECCGCLFMYDCMVITLGHATKIMIV